MTEEKKQELFPYFAYLYSQQLNPEKYGNLSSVDEWVSLIEESPEDIDEITAAASELSDEDWASLDKEYAEKQAGESQSVMMAKKGAKLKKLQDMKKAKTKKCSCGCDMITTKEDGGKLSSKCACNCGGGKIKKNQEGGSVEVAPESAIVAKKGDKLNKIKGSKISSLKNKKPLSKEMDKEKLKELKQKAKK